jgi:hypothetical protein
MKKVFMLIVLIVFVPGCAWIHTWVPARKALQEDISIPSGKIEGNQFTGIRYPFKVSAPPSWKLSTEFPDFLEQLGYDRPFSTDKEQTELYAYNPETKSHILFDFTPTGRYARFNQKIIEEYTSVGTDSFKAELDKQYGKGVVKPEYSRAEKFSLKGVQYAAKKYATYTVKGTKWEQGWIYGFTEPYQIFILYTIFEKEGANDREDIKKILDSFEFLMKK